MQRKAWDRLVSSSGLVIAIVLLAMGAMAIYGGNFGRNNVRDRLTPGEGRLRAVLRDVRPRSRRRSATSQGSK